MSSFIKNEKLIDFLRNLRRQQIFEGVLNLTLVFASLDSAIDRENVQVENYGDEPTIVDCDDAIDRCIAYADLGEDSTPL